MKPGARRTLQLTSSCYRDLLGRLSAVPGVEAASFAATFPGGFAIQLPEQPTSRADHPGPNGEVDAGTDSLSPGFFDTLGIVRLAGRDFTWHDDAQSSPVVILNTVLATRLFPNGNGIGRRVRIGGRASPSVFPGIRIRAPPPGPWSR